MNIKNILSFLHLLEKLKFELRHSWTSAGRQESVADHSWRVSLMVILFAPYLMNKINIEKAIKMAIIHDLAEFQIGDIHFFEVLKDKNKLKNKFFLEKKVFMNIKRILSKNLGEEIYDLWIEFEKADSYEAKFVLALDKLEVHLQHNEADISTWTDEEIQSVFNGYLDKYCDFDPLIKELKISINNESIEKIKKSNRKIIDNISSFA